LLTATSNSIGTIVMNSKLPLVLPISCDQSQFRQWLAPGVDGLNAPFCRQTHDI
jgi:hypothetical protein